MSLSQVVRDRDRVHLLFSDHIGRVFEYAALDQITDALVHQLRAQRHAAFDSLRVLLGADLQPTVAWRAAWRLAANLSRLRAGEPVMPWSAQVLEERVVLKIHRVDNTWYFGQNVLQVRLRCYTGTPASDWLTKRWSYGLARYAAMQIGFHRYDTQLYPYQSPQQLVGLYFETNLLPEMSRSSPEFKEILCSDTLKRRNREEVLRLRFRDGMQCPRDFTHACHSCAVGFLDCPAGTHRDTYFLATCCKCGRGSVIFDPEISTSICQRCAAEEPT